MSERFIDSLETALVNSTDNLIHTENGALGYRTTGKNLLDLNFATSSLRTASEDVIWAKFSSALADDERLAMAWLFFARDIRGGMGERRLFRVVLRNLLRDYPEFAICFLRFVPEYGRWDDIICMLDDDQLTTAVKDFIRGAVCEQLMTDLSAAPKKDGKVSLLGKWMPSVNSSSKKSRKLALEFCSYLGITECQYRKILSSLRKRIGIVERQMSAGEWADINYEHVPSRASMLYHNAFSRHDAARYESYIESVKNGDAKINASTLFPHEILCKLRSGEDASVMNELWRALPDHDIPASTLVVVDGSGSMLCPVGSGKATCMDVSHAMGIYFAERLTGPFRNKFITFSSRPQLVSFPDGSSLSTKFNIIKHYNDCSNTNIEKTFDLILNAAIAGHMSQDELPKNILIISDMEFDTAMYQYEYRANMTTLFGHITAKFADNGYKMPRIIFWNVCSRTGTIPMRENENGVALVSGFSPNVASMIMSEKLDPYECLVETLTGPRYRPIIEEVNRNGAVFKE